MDDRVAGVPVSKRVKPARSTRIARRVFTPAWLRFGVVAEMEIPGRNSGERRNVVVRPFKYEGSWYLCSFASDTNWVRNLRSAGRGQFRHKGRTTAVQAVEIVGEERDRVLVGFKRNIGPMRREFNRLPDHGDHPTFRLDPLGEAARD